MSKTKEIEYHLLKIYRKIGIDQPTNHNQILEFIEEDINAAACPERWNDMDVDIAFRRFLESFPDKSDKIDS